MTRWTARTVAAVLACTVLATLAHAGQVEKVTLWSKDGAMHIKAARASLKAGPVTFDVTNRRDSSMQHEMIVTKLTPEQVRKPDSLPYDNKAGRVDEEKIDGRGEVPELQPGKSGSLTLDLEPGTYMLFCNIPGHYRAKMYTIIQVR